MEASVHTTIMAALVHFGLSCYDGRHCVEALNALGMDKAADALDEALSARVYSAPGVRDWQAEEVKS